MTENKNDITLQQIAQMIKIIEHKMQSLSLTIDEINTLQKTVIQSMINIIEDKDKEINKSITK